MTSLMASLTTSGEAIKRNISTSEQLLLTSTGRAIIPCYIGSEWERRTAGLLKRKPGTKGIFEDGRDEVSISIILTTGRNRLGFTYSGLNVGQL